MNQRNVTEITRDVMRHFIPRSIRNSLRAPGRTLWWTMADARHALGFDTTLRIREGFSIRSHPAAYKLAYHSQLDQPEEVLEFDNFVTACEPSMRFFDLGAHFGLFSIAAAHFGGPTATVVAVDASPTATDMLHVQAALNAMSNRITIECAAVGAADGWMDMVATGAAGAGYFVASSETHPAHDRTRTPMVTIDTLAARHGRPTHVKLDIEGFEGQALRGGTATFTGDRPPKLFIELHHEMIAQRGGDPAEALDILRDFGYSMFDLHGQPIAAARLLALPLTRVVGLPRRRGEGTRPVA